MIAVVLALVFGVAIALIATWLPRGRLSNLLRRVPAVGVSVPNFWIGLLLIQVFAFTLGWFPAMGSEGWQSYVLPAVTMAIPTAAVLAQVLTRSFDDTLGEAYITTARAKGLSRFAVQLRHAFRNAALPTLTILGLLVGATVTGSIVVETVFSRNGVGRLAQESVLAAGHPGRAGDRRARRGGVRRRQPRRRPALSPARSPHRPNPEGDTRMTDLLEKPVVARPPTSGRRMPRRGRGIRRPCVRASRAAGRSSRCCAGPASSSRSRSSRSRC